MPTSIDTAIVSAMPEEIGPLAARLRARRPLALPRIERAFLGYLCDRAHLLAVTGEGSGRARSAIASLLARYRVRRVLIVGVAGALSTDLRAGRLVIAEQVLEPGAPALAPLRSLYASARHVTGAAPVLALTTTELILDAAPKRDLLALLPPRSSAIVDLESSMHARAAELAGVPWLVLRAISDEAHESLPAFLAQCRRNDGSLERIRIVARALPRPSSWIVLSRLAARTRSCARTIADAVESIAASDGAHR